MRNVTPVTSPWVVLADRGAHFVLCSSSKKAIATGWQKQKPAFKSVLAHAGAEGLIAVIPSSLGCAVVDIDEGGDDAFHAVVNALGAPIVRTSSKREGGYHAWFRDSSGAGNRKWQINGAGGGDVRGDKGYVILWDPVRVAAGLAEHFDNAAPVDLTLLPSPERGAATGAKAIAEAPPGDRNNTLNREVFRAVLSGSLDEPAVRADAIAGGLPPVEVDKTIASAKAGALALTLTPEAGTGAMDAKRAALWYAAQWGEVAAHSLGLGWFVRESGESIWTEDPGGVRIRCRIRDGLTGAESPAKRGTRTRDVELEIRDELDVPADRWDTAEGVLGLPDGRVWDTALGTPREARPDEFVSKRLGAMPEPGEPAVWLQHLGEVFAAHPQAEDVVAWLRWWLRYSLGTSCTDESIVFLDGPPRSGKSTLAESWLAAVGGYGVVRGGDRLAGDGLQHKQWLAGLAGARVVLVGEIPKGGRWDVANINSLASGEVLEANRMRQDSMEFRSVSKLLITGNHRPSAAAGSGFWRRLRLLECRSPPVTPDPTRKAQIRNELGRILHWALTGPEHADVPATITNAVAEYRAESDSLAGWFEACVEEDAGACETVKAVWQNYRRFCAGVPVDPLSEAAFGRELSERFGTSVRTRVDGKQARVRYGLRLVV